MATYELPIDLELPANFNGSYIADQLEIPGKLIDRSDSQHVYTVTTSEFLIKITHTRDLAKAFIQLLATDSTDDDKRVIIYYGTTRVNSTEFYYYSEICRLHNIAWLYLDNSEEAVCEAQEVIDWL